MSRKVRHTLGHTGRFNIRSLLATVTATTLIAASSFLDAAALPLPADPTDPTTRELWINPLTRSGDSYNDVELDIIGFDMPEDRTTINVGENFSARVVVSNNTSEELSSITFSVQRQAAAIDTASARTALTADDNSFLYYATNLELDKSLSPGESLETRVPIPTNAADAITLAITEPGSYPVRIALSGRLDEVATHLDSQRFLLPVTDESENGTLTPTTMIYPISAETHVLGGETGEAPEDPPLLLSSDELATELSAQGRLTKLIDAFSDAPAQVKQASCLAIDPELLSVIERMTSGYTVSEQRTSSVKANQRLRDLWTASNQPTVGTPGSGAADAQVFLDSLRDVAANTCTVALPWANTDLNAVSDTGNQWLMREALEQGAETITDILGSAPVDNTVIPGSGYIEYSTARNLGWADTRTQDTSVDQQWEMQANLKNQPIDTSAQTALDDPLLTPDPTKAPAPINPVSVLVADNTVWNTPTSNRFHVLSQGITAVSYDGSLAATLATIGLAPETAGYSNLDSRYDLTMDSRAARLLSAQAAVRLSVDNSDAETPVLLMPPASIAASEAEALVDTMTDLMERDISQPFTLQQYLSPNSSEVTALSEAVAITGMPEEQSFGSPFDDPSAITDTEILRAAQQATYIDDLTGLMLNDPAISLTRYGFTAPLRRDLLRAMTLSGRRAITMHSAATSDADQLLNANRGTLQQLRSSVALLPPGNVYTRTSNSSPLIIVAQNGLPLPAETQIIYTAPEGAKINTPGMVRIPASGSITLQMTADLPDNLRTDLKVWLASPNGATISDAVEISVQPRPNLGGTIGIVAAGTIVIAGLLMLRVLRIRKKQSTTASSRSPNPPGNR